ncbi:MAG: protease HtpX [Buchnera aphidicola (Chaetogeoica yunlongensis)]
MIRIILFLLTNLSVIFIFNLILSFTGVNSKSVHGLLIFSSVFGFGGAIISLLLSKWIALKSINAKIIQCPINDTERWLINTVKNQANTMGLKTPDIAIYHALDMNAFATGARKNSALIAVSTGLLENMNRNEAEAVLAHEISHIANGDMVTMTLIQGVMNTFVIFISRIIAQIISSIFSEEKNDNSSNQDTWIYTICSVTLELLFGILASIITMWFSRHREFYADSGSAKLVGRENMIAALQKLKISYEPQEQSNLLALCIHGKNNSLLNLFMSHPSLNKRIQALYNQDYM